MGTAGIHVIPAKYVSGKREKSLSVKEKDGILLKRGLVASAVRSHIIYMVSAITAKLHLDIIIIIAVTAVIAPAKTPFIVALVIATVRPEDIFSSGELQVEFCCPPGGMAMFMPRRKDHHARVNMLYKCR